MADNTTPPLGPINGNCLEAWQTFGPPETVENAHDLGNRDIYKAPLNNNVTDRLAPAPEG